MKDNTTKTVCVYCASSPEIDTTYMEAAREVGRICALHRHRLLTGAGGEGLMGAVSDGCQQAGGHVTGIIPQWMVDRGWLRPDLDKVIITQTIAERKKMFRDLCDAIIMLPGGYGTMEEFFETITQKQLGLFHKPIVIYNPYGFFNLLIDWMRQCRDQRFLRHDSDLDLFTVVTSADQLPPLLDTI